MKEAYEVEFAATIERAEKQILLAKHGRRLLALLDDEPVTPGDARRTYTHAAQGRQILNDAEDDLKSWVLQLDEATVPSAEDSGDLSTGAPTGSHSHADGRTSGERGSRLHHQESAAAGGDNGRRQESSTDGTAAVSGPS